MTENPQHPHVLRMRAAFEKSLAGPWIILLAGVIMCNISWHKWPDLLVDYGTQIYIPWRLSEGEVLFKDISYFFGPASAYLHS